MRFLEKHGVLVARCTSHLGEYAAKLGSLCYKRAACVSPIGELNGSVLKWKKYRQKMRILLVWQSSVFVMLSLVPNSAVCQPHPPTPIAFASDVSGNWEIYLTDTTGNRSVNLTNNPAADYYPTWAPDSTQIAFFSRRDGNHEIYVMAADGTHQRRLTHHPATDKAPAWSPDGTRLAFTSNRSGHFDIYLFHLNNGEVERLTENPFEDEAPAWSPDGRTLVFHSKRELNWDIYVINVHSRAEQRLTHQPLMDTYPAWSPDGRQIVYASMHAEVALADFDLYIMDAVDGGNKKALTDTPTDEAVPAWAPDGNAIAFQFEKDGRWVIHLMRADGSERHELINNGAWAAQPKWSSGASDVLPIVPLGLQIQLWGKIRAQ